jgi:replicative DNA helicase|tara:strand:+ start:1052 stop:1993 length:942 start_codon:yes stop_codon:yes gene_type:complete
MTQEKLPPELRDPFKEGGFKSINKAISASLHQVTDGMKGKRTIYPTKWPRLNKNLLGGLQPGKMYVIAGRPGVGKSAFSNQLIFDLLDNNQFKKLLVLYWSFEMPGYQQILRAGAKGSNKQVSELLSVEHKLENDAYEAFKKEVLKYSHYPIYFNNIPRDMEFVKKSNVDVTNKYPDHTIINVFDHSRLILSEKDQELQKLNEVSKGCMWLQAKMGCINILLSQLNRNIEQEHRAKAQYQPLLTDLFGGDSIGQDAHVVMMLQRPNDLYGITDKYCDEDPIGLLALHVEKNRDGLLGMIPYEAEMSTFTINER